MIIHNLEELEEFIRRLRQQAELTLVYNPLKVEVKIYQKTRSLEQNRYMWAVFQHIADFYQETGFMPDNLNNSLKFFNKDVAKIWFCAKYDVPHTSSENTKQMVDFIDAVQADMIQQTKGEYQPIYPEILIIGEKK